MGLPLGAGCNSMYTCADKMTKLVKITPCVVGDGGLSAPATANYSFIILFAVIEFLRWCFMIATLDS